MLKKLIAWLIVAYLAAILVALYAIKRPSPTETKTAPSETQVLLKKPDFSAIKDIPTRKKAFFSYLRPMINIQNKKLESDRAALLALTENDSLNRKQRVKLAALARKYHVLEPDEPLAEDASSVESELLLRVDTIPPALVLAQAANESSWGRSRFAREGNNYFGQWCFTAGCGIVPAKRPEGDIHEVRKFESAQESVAAYFNNINSHPAYSDLRDLRAQMRAQNETITGSALAAGLQSYSERGAEYVEELRTMMRVNKLEP